MVDKITLAGKIDSRLRSLKTRLAALPWYAERYGPQTERHTSPGADFDALLYEWRDTLDRFEGAHEWYLDGQMSDAQADRQRENLALLASQLPVIRLLGLAVPSGELAAAVAGVPPAPARAKLA